MQITLGILLSLYLIAAVVLSRVQEHLLFPAPTIPGDDLIEMARIAGAAELLVPSEEETLYGWHSPAGGTHAVLYFHGNASYAAANILTMRAVNAAGWDFICVSPRGYPGSTGAPSPGFLRADALAAWSHTTETLGFSPEQIVLHGRSLGGGMAGELLAEVAPGGVILESTFRSMARLVQEKVPYFPMGLILKYPMRTEERDVSAPVLILHGDADEVVPVAHARALAEHFTHAEYVEVPGKGHNDGLLQDPVASRALRAWLDSLR
ncbi:MAG: alpha/beta hydrolase [Myxococcota bacterium]|nr:alpha/beta hydrolase [Myxococcota bacterium]